MRKSLKIVVATAGTAVILAGAGTVEATASPFSHHSFHGTRAQAIAARADLRVVRTDLALVRGERRGVRAENRHFGFGNGRFFVRARFRHDHLGNPAITFANAKYKTISRLARVDARLEAFDGILTEIAATDPNGRAAAELPTVTAALTKVNSTLAAVAEANDFAALETALGRTPATPSLTAPTA